MARIKSLGVDHVYCWHALFGYWGGLHPDAKGMKKYRPVMTTPRHTPGLLAVEPSQAWDPITLGGVGVCENAEDLGVFYEELHAYLARSGVDGVKVDGQAVVGGLGRGVGGGPALARRLHEMLEAFGADPFSHQRAHQLHVPLLREHPRFSRVQPGARQRPFYPTNRASHTVHVANVAYNSVFMGEIVTPDWDMFQSHCGEAGAMHAAARAVGGCPVYVSDAPGKHDFRLCASWCFPADECSARRCPGVRRATALRGPLRDGATALKIWNRNERGASWGVSTFRERRGPAPRHLRLQRRGTPRRRRRRRRRRTSKARRRPPTENPLSMTCSSFARTGSRAMRRMKKDRSVAPRLAMEPKHWEVFPVAPVERVGDVEWTPVALDQMLNGGGAVREASVALVREIETRRASFDVSRQTFVEWAFIGLTGMLKSKARGTEPSSRGREKTRPKKKNLRAAAAATVYGCGALVCYSNRAPDDVAWTASRSRSGSIGTRPARPVKSRGGDVARDVPPEGGHARSADAFDCA